MLSDDSIGKFRSNSLLPSRSRSANLIALPRNYGNLVSNSYIDGNNSGYDDEYYTPRREPLESDSFQQTSSLRLGNVHDIVRNKNTTERIQDLEKTNLRLRKMIQYASIDKLNLPETTKLIETDRDIRFNLSGPPVLRQGRIGSSWRHIKQTNNYSNSNLLFVDGTVRIDDSTRYPPRLYGYPPKANAIPRQMSGNLHCNSARYEPTGKSQDLLGLGVKSLTQLDLPVNNMIRKSSSTLNNYENQYAVRAKEGFEYWSKDNRYPENNKPKAKLYTTGAYKTFHGLSDSLLKT